MISHLSENQGWAGEKKFHESIMCPNATTQTNALQICMLVVIV